MTKMYFKQLVKEDPGCASYLGWDLRLRVDVLRL